MSKKGIAIATKDWSNTEDTVAEQRVARCNNTIGKLLGGDTPSTDRAAFDTGKEVRIAVALSGGGWRAMASSVALFDGLATPLEEGAYAFNGNAQATHLAPEGENSIKLLDTVSHAFGLSGGSWFLFSTLAGAERNPFHTSIEENRIRMAKEGTDKANVVSTDRKEHPWLYGPTNHFDSRQHTYKGLEHIMDIHHVRESLNRIKVPTFVADLLPLQAIPFAVLSGKLGDSFVERWSNFIANNILSFKDDGNDMNGKEARDIKLSELRRIIDSADFPYVVCSAIADRVDKRSMLCSGVLCTAGPALARGSLVNKNSPTSIIDPTPIDARRSKRRYEWVEISPYYLRNPTQAVDHFTRDIDASIANFGAKKDKKREHPFRVHNAMAVCGSAFAFDRNSAPLLTKLFGVETGTNPLLGPDTLTHISYGPKTGVNELTSLCRDAGIDFNVPFPPTITDSSARKPFDIIIAMDAGAEATGAGELAEAVAEGYLDIDEEATSLANTTMHHLAFAMDNDGGIKFAEGQKIRVYRVANGGPTIIYFMGLTERSTMEVAVKAHEIQADVRRVRESVKANLVPVLLREIARLRAPDGIGSVKIEETKKLASVGSPGLSESQGLTPTSPPTTRGDGASAASISCTETTESPNSYTPDEAAVPETTFPLCACQYLCQAIANDQVHSAIDSYIAVEDAALTVATGKRSDARGELGVGVSADTRAMVVQVLESEAIRLISNADATTPTPLFIDATSTELLNLKSTLKQLGILDDTFALTPMWTDFYAATATARNLPTSRAQNALVQHREGLPLPKDIATQTPILAPSANSIGTIMLLLGSIVRRSENSDLLKEVTADIIEKAYLAEVTSTATEITEKREHQICRCVVDFFAELLEPNNQDETQTSNALLVPSSGSKKWDAEVLSAFIKLVQALHSAANGATHVSKLVIAIIEHASEESLVLLSVLMKGGQRTSEVTDEVERYASAIHKYVDSLVGSSLGTIRNKAQIPPMPEKAAMKDSLRRQAIVKSLLGIRGQ